MRESSGSEHAETHNSQHAPEERRRKARFPEGPIQGQEVRDPQDEDQQVKTILNRASRSDIREPLNQLLSPRIEVRSHEHNHHNEDDDENDAPENTGQTTPTQDAPVHGSHATQLPTRRISHVHAPPIIGKTCALEGLDETAAKASTSSDADLSRPSRGQGPGAVIELSPRNAESPSRA